MEEKMKIKLSNGGEADVSDEDAWVSLYRWRSTSCPPAKTLYAVSDIGGKRVRMHRLIIGAAGPARVDHRDGNGLNNRRDNLRIATASQNMANCIGHKNNTSGYKGVYFVKKKNRWRVQIYCQNKRYTFGYFKTKEQAALRYNQAAIELFGEFARLNCISPA